MPLLAADLPPTHQVSAEFAFERTFLARLRYGHGLRAGSRPLLVGGSLAVPIFAASGLTDGAVTADIETLLPIRGGLSVGAGACLGLAAAEDASGELLALTAGLTARPGWYTPTGRVTMELGFEPTLATHIRHSELVRETFEDRYPGGGEGVAGPQDGWYAAPASRFTLGAGGAFLTPSGAFAGLGGGWSRLRGPLPAFPDIGVLPFYVHAEGGWQW